MCRICRLGLRADEVEVELRTCEIDEGVERPTLLADGRDEPVEDAVVRRLGLEEARSRLDEDDVRREEVPDWAPSSKPESCRLIFRD